MTREKAIDIIKCLAWHTRPNEEDVEQAIKELQDNSYELWKESYEVEHERNIRLEEKIKALEQEPCNDYISRADVEQTVEDNILCYTHSDRPIDQDPDTECYMAIRTALRMLRKDLRKLPPITPHQKMGRWIYICNSKVNGLKICKCSNCKNKTYGSHKFCPNCGAKMGD